MIYSIQSKQFLQYLSKTPAGVKAKGSAEASRNDAARGMGKNMNKGPAVKPTSA